MITGCNDEMPATKQKALNIDGMRVTSQRALVIEIIRQGGGHLDADEIYRRARQKEPRLSLSTVYRTLKLLVKAGLATERQFGDGFTRFEPVHREEHHDHLICINCGKIVEFKDDRIEELQNGVAGKHNFRVTDHKLELYGYCNRCE